MSVHIAHSGGHLLVDHLKAVAKLAAIPPANILVHFDVLRSAVRTRHRVKVLNLFTLSVCDG